MKAWSRDIRFIVAAFLLLFAGLAALSFFLLTGESGRSRILVEYEADRIASSLADTFRAQGALEQKDLDPRLRAFALYAPDGEALVKIGDAPDTLDFGSASPGFAYDGTGRTLTLTRLLGMGGPAMMGGGGPGGMMGGPGFPMPMMRGGTGGSGHRFGAPHPAGALFLSMDISAARRSQRLYGAAAVTSPFVVAGIAALFLALLFSNVRHRRRAQEQDTLARLGESARTLAHEIRNPLSAIRIQTGLLRKKAGGEPTPQLDAIDEEVQRLSLLSRRVSDFLRNPRGEPARVRLDPFLRELAAREPSPVSYTTAEGAASCEVSFDADMLRSVVENLVRNAFESYADPAGPRPVEIALARERGTAVIAVRDTGRGIPPAIAERVFDPFFTDKVNGSGVGLSLSRRFAEAAGGTLALLPRHGGGTEARLTLPLEAPR